MASADGPSSGLTCPGRAATQAVVYEIHRQFVKMVAKRRNFTPEKARSLGNGRIYTGSQALANGLIDAIGGETEARQWLADKRGISKSLPIHDMRINRGTRNLFGLVEEMFGITSFSERLRLDGLISLWQPE